MTHEMNKEENINRSITLHEAAMTDCLETVEVLISQGEKIDSPNEKGCTPLMLAVVAGNTDIVASLIAHGANINTTNKFGASLIAVAAAKGDIKIVRLLLEAGVKPKNESVLHNEPKHLPPISAAAANGHEEVVKLLIDKGFPLNEAAPISGASALHLAVSGLHEGCVSVLLHRGANVNARDAAGYTALDLITLHPWREKHNQERVNAMLFALQASACLLRPGWKEDMLKCAQGDDVEKMACLLTELQVFQANSKLVAETHENFYIPTVSTALINAVIHGNTQMCSQLISNGAAIDIMTEDGMTPLMLAATHGHMSVTKLLLDSGANVHLRCFSTRHTAFEMASLEDKIPTELLRLLAQRTLRPHLTLSPCPKLASYPRPLSPCCNFQSPRMTLVESLQSPSQATKQYALTPQPSKCSFLFPPPMKKGSSSLPGSPSYQNSVLKTSWPYSPQKVNKKDLMGKVMKDSDISQVDPSTANKMKLWIKRVSDKIKN